MLSTKNLVLSLIFASSLVVQIGCKVRFRLNAIQGSGIEQTETREVASFQTLNLSGVANVEATIGPETALTVSFDDNLLELVVTEVIDGELRVYTEGNYNSKLPLVIKITTPDVNRLELSGVGSLDLSGVDNEQLEVRVSGVGSLKASGKVQELNVNLSGTGKANLEDLIAQSVTVNVSGVGNAKVHAVESIKAKTSGVGGITIFGNPKKVDSKSSGVGSISMSD